MLVQAVESLGGFGLMLNIDEISIYVIIMEICILCMYDSVGK